MVRTIRALVVLAGVLAPAVAYAQDAQPLSKCKSFSAHQNVPMTHTQIAEASGDQPAVFKNTLMGDVQINCDDMQVFADTIEWRDDEQTVSLTGNVLFVQPGVRIYADHAIVNRITHLGTFYQASGYAQIQNKPADKSLFDGLDPDMFFWGDALVKTADRTYRLVGGGFTSCVQATPRWDMGGSSGSVTLEKHVMLKNAVLHVKDVPLFYVPVMYYPINKEQRATGFLMPKYGSSTVGGFTLSNAFFWAIDRSQDATFYQTWFKKTGQSFGSRYRYISAPGSSGEMNFNVIAEKAQEAADGTVTGPATKSYNISGNANQELPDHFRLLANVDYFNNATTQQLYQEDIMDTSQRTRSINASLSGVVQRLQIGASFQQNDIYNNQLSAQAALESASRQGYLPKVTLGLTQKKLGTSRVYFGAGGEIAYLVGQDNLDNPATDHSVFRLDGGPQVRVPLSTLPFLTATTTANWRLTEWFRSVDPVTGGIVDTNLTRQILTVNTTLTGPVFSRVYQPNDAYAEKIKHLIEPNFSLQYISPFDKLTNVIKNDGTDWIIGGTTTIGYGVTNRLLAKRKGSVGTPEILRIDIGQSWYNNALAATFDPNSQSIGLAPPTNFSPIQITVVGNPTNTLTARFATDIDAQFKTPRSYTASGTLTEKLLQITGGWSKRRVIPGLPTYSDPLTASHYLTLQTSIKRADGRFGGMYAFTYDVEHSIWLQRRLVAYYNSQCCGVQVDYATADISNLGLANTPSNHKFGVSFTLAGIGSFSNPLGSQTR
jgi:LPS-assembly protein